MSNQYCYGKESHISVTELESKAWHDSDVYRVSCSKCGATSRNLARRPTETILKCEKGED